MPQLMPLMWIVSMFMISFILMIMIDLFFYTTKDNMCKITNNNMIYCKNYLW